MQPYFFPYLGYFQLLASVDRFIVYDDVAYIKNGWINRNRIAGPREPQYLTIPLRNASPHVRIDQVDVMPDRVAWRRRTIERLRHAYARSSQREEIVALVADAIAPPVTRIADIALRSLVNVLQYLRVDCEVVRSSERRYGNETLRGQERVIDICRREQADVYVNLPGGRALFDERFFADAGIELRFLQPRLGAYPQRSADFLPGLSILDPLMQLSGEHLRAHLLAAEID